MNHQGTKAKKNRQRGGRSLRSSNVLYLMILPAMIAVAVFGYGPMFGLLAAFKNYNIWKGFFKSPWAGNYGLQHFIEIFNNRALMSSVYNTVKLSLLNLFTTLPLELIMALLFNELTFKRFKKTVQTISYMPHFLSWISIIGLTTVIFDEYGLVNEVAMLINPNHVRQLYLARQDMFVPLLVFLNNWREIGYGSIFFLSAITSIDPQLYEAAAVDGAGRWTQTIHITLPCISTTAVILFVLSIGGVLGSNFDLVYGLRNPFIDFETIDTVIYRMGLGAGQFSLTIALGLARGLIALALTLLANLVSKRISNFSVL